MASSTVENYLKRLYMAQQQPSQLLEPDQRVPMGKLSSAMEVAPGTATTMVKALSEAGLVDYEPRSGVRLSDRGERLALHVLRRHRLVELFLVEVLGLDWSEVHDEAEELEHAVSDKVMAKIDAMLNHPVVDPHGDPIPTANGLPESPPPISLATCHLDQTVRVARVMDQDPGFLRFIRRTGLTPGVDAVVRHRDPEADAVTIHTTSQQENPVTLGTAAAAKVLVEPM